MRLTKDSLESLRVADQKGRINLGSRYAGKRFAFREEPDGSAILTPVTIVPTSEGDLTLRRLEKAFDDLERLGDNWDGHGSPAPSAVTLATAREALAMLHAGALARRLPWEDPHLAVNERGQVTLEWWRRERALTLTVRGDDHIDYLLAWGADIQSQMEDGEVTRLSDFGELCRRLYNDLEPTE